MLITQPHLIRWTGLASIVANAALLYGFAGYWEQLRTPDDTERTVVTLTIAATAEDMRSTADLQSNARDRISVVAEPYDEREAPSLDTDRSITPPQAITNAAPRAASLLPEKETINPEFMPLETRPNVANGASWKSPHTHLDLSRSALERVAREAIRSAAEDETPHQRQSKNRAVVMNQQLASQLVNAPDRVALRPEAVAPNGPTLEGGGWSQFVSMGGKCFRVIEADPLTPGSVESWYAVDCPGSRR